MQLYRGTSLFLRNLTHHEKFHPTPIETCQILGMIDYLLNTAAKAETGE